MVETTDTKTSIDSSDTKNTASTGPGENISRYRWFVLGLLFCVYFFNFLDRQIFAILQEAIKIDLHSMRWAILIILCFTIWPILALSLRRAYTA